MDGDRVSGLRAETPGRIARDPRRSRRRRRWQALRRCATCAGLEVEDLGAPMDVLWLRLSKRAGDGSQTLGRIQAGRSSSCSIAATIGNAPSSSPKAASRRCAPKGSKRSARRSWRSIRRSPTACSEIASWDDVKLLTVRVDRLKRWYRPGLLCIGDAAHAMSPVGGVGINLAIQDAVAAANISGEPLRQGAVSGRSAGEGARAARMADRDDASGAALRAKARSSAMC